MEQIERSLADTRLAKGKIRKGSFINVFNHSNVGGHRIYPDVFLICKINIVKGVVDKDRILSVCMPLDVIGRQPDFS